MCSEFLHEFHICTCNFNWALDGNNIGVFLSPVAALSFGVFALYIDIQDTLNVCKLSDFKNGSQ